MKKKICIVLCLGCIGTVSVVGCSNKNFDSKVTGDNQTTTENVSDILNDQEKKEGGYENESSSHADDKENSADDYVWGFLSSRKYNIYGYEFPGKTIRQ